MRQISDLMGRSAVALTLLALVVVGAPGDAEAKLRVAWASQYEWKESGVENAVLDFTYTYQWQGAKEGQGWTYEGQGQVVVDQSGIVRRHYPGATEARRKQIDAHVVWVVERFVRRPFEKEFEEMVFEGPETSKEGHLRVAVAPTSAPDSRRYYLLKDDRLVGREFWVGATANPQFDRLSYTLGDLEDGYVILGEDVTWTRGGQHTTTVRRLTTATGDKCPYPKEYGYSLKSTTGQSTVGLDFLPPKVNVEHPAVGDPKARDALKAAWAKRYVLPRNLRIEAEFHRRVDKDLAKLGWWDTVKGNLQVWGMDDISVGLDARLFRDATWTNEIKRLSEGHFRWLFRWMRDDPFEEAFKGCGFEFVKEGDQTMGVSVFGYEHALGFLLEDEAITGYLRHSTEEEGWWRFRLKKTRDGRVRIESMSTKFGHKSCKLGIKYVRQKGFEVPRYFEALGGPRWGKDEGGHGVAKYSLKKLKVSLPGSE
jgi:hypothetical protein